MMKGGYYCWYVINNSNFKPYRNDNELESNRNKNLRDQKIRDF